MAYTTKKALKSSIEMQGLYLLISSTLNNPLPLAVFDYETPRLSTGSDRPKQVRIARSEFAKVSGFNRTKANLKLRPNIFELVQETISQWSKKWKIAFTRSQGNVRIKTPNDLVMSPMCIYIKMVLLVWTIKTD